MLLDTHVFLWSVAEEHKLSRTVRPLLRDDGVEVRVSIVTLWEIAIKAGLNQLLLPADLLGFFRNQMSVTGFGVLPIEAEHVVAVRDLPLHHQDPFDRLLIVQSRLEGLSLVSNDRYFSRYGVDLVW